MLFVALLIFSFFISSVKMRIITFQYPAFGSIRSFLCLIIQVVLVVIPVETGIQD